MIAGKPIRSAVSLLYLSVALCCFVPFFIYLFTEANLSLRSLYRDKSFFFFVVSLGIGASSLVASASQHQNFAKLLSYLVAMGFLLATVSILHLTNYRKSDVILAFVPTIAPAILFFLVGFSKITQLKESSSENYDTLDSDFLVIEESQTQESSIFWKPNRIIAFAAFVFCLILFPSLLSAGAPVWTISAPCVLLVLSVVLALAPKIGSWIVAIASLLAGIGITGSFITLLIINTPPKSSDRIFLIVAFSVIMLGIFLFGCGIAMFLLSKEAKAEWKK